VTASLQPDLPLISAVFSILWKTSGQMFVYSNTLYKIQIFISWEEFCGCDFEPQ